jgi:hypothetical protein
MRRLATLAIIGALAASFQLPASGPAAAGERIEYDFFGNYLRRIDPIFPGAGDARDVNAVTHMIDPWPPYVGNRRIPANGERMVGAVERYRDVSKLRLAPPPLAPVQIEPSGFSSSSGGGATTAAPAR